MQQHVTLLSNKQTHYVRYRPKLADIWSYDQTAPERNE